MTDATNNDTPPEHEPGRDGAERPATAASVARLAREVEALRDLLEPLDGLDERVIDLANTVTDLTNALAAQGRRGNSTGPVSWLDLPDGADGTEPLDTEDVARLLGELVVWVERIYLRYADATRSFPECWLWHPDVLEELTWLRHAWTCAYRTEGAAAALAWDWHDRYRPGAVRRIRELAGRCSLDNHTRRRDPAPTATGVGGLGQLAAWWATARHSAPPPPSAEVIEAAREAEAARLRDGGHR